MSSQTPEPEGKRLKHAQKHVEPILAGDKDVTVRYDDEKGIEEGDTLILTGPDGDPFAEAEVEHTSVLEAEVAYHYIVAWGRNYPHNSVGSLVEALNHHYDADIDWETDVKVILFDVTAALHR